MARSRKPTLILTCLKLLVFATAVGAGAYVGVQVLAQKGWTPMRVAQKPAAQPTVRRTTSNETGNVRVYVVNFAGGEPRLSPVTYKVARSVDAKRAAINQMIVLSARGGDNAGLIPRGTKVLSLRTERGIATLDLSREFIGNFHGGSLQESLTLGALVQTLTQFRDVNRVRILVEGHAVDTLGGHFVLSEPLSAKSLRNSGATE